MQSLTLDPLTAVGLVRLHAPRSDVLRTLGLPERSCKKVPSSLHPTDSWSSGALQVFYSGADPVVEYIELSRGSEVEAVLLGRSVFGTPAKVLVSLLGASTHVQMDETGCSYVCPELELSLWRVNDAQEHFNTVGLGTRGYFSGGAA